MNIILIVLPNGLRTYWLILRTNPCAVVASAMIRYGTDSQKELGYKIAEDCFKHS